MFNIFHFYWMVTLQYRKLFYCVGTNQHLF